MNELSSLLPSALRQLPRSEELSEKLVFVLWPQVVGEPLGQRTKPFRLFKSTLIVCVPSLTWKRELRHLQEEILGKLQTAMGQKAVLALEFRVDPDFDQAATKAEEPFVPSSKEPVPLPLDTIQDLELRHILAAAASNYFNRP